MRKLIFGGLMALGFSLAAASVANAASCERLADNCVSNNGQKGVCHGDAKAACKRTCEYIGPYSNRKFIADSGCKAAKK